MSATHSALDPRHTRELVADHNVVALSQIVGEASPREVMVLLESLPATAAAVVFRMLGKDVAMEVFDRLKAVTQADLVHELSQNEVTDFFAELDPDDQVELLDELPAKVAGRLLRSVEGPEIQGTMTILGYPQGSLGRKMSPHYARTQPTETAAEAIARLATVANTAETIYTVPVTGDGRVLLGVVSLRDLLGAQPNTQVKALMATPVSAHVSEDAEDAARRCLDYRVLAMPVLDSENRLVGIFTIDDAIRIIADADAEDQARAGASEPLRRPYLLTPVLSITRARIVWLLVLALSGILTVNVLELFEATLQQKVALALFIPLLTGIGGNTGSQAATTVTRALAIGDVEARDALPVAAKESRTGLMLGTLLGMLGFAVASVFYGTGVGAVIGITLLVVCPLAATVGGVMPLVAKACRVDPAVFSTPFISTFCDATGLLVYFTVATVVLGL